MRHLIAVVLALTAIGSMRAQAASLEVTMILLKESGVGEAIGHVTAEDGPYGMVLTPDLGGLTPGMHGFHVHQNSDCRSAVRDGRSVPGLAAGGHYDPDGTGHHAGPYRDGHLGDLPSLFVDPDGAATVPVLAPRVKVSDLRGRSLMIHAGGDNYSDSPKALGGGGARMACGVVR